MVAPCCIRSCHRRHRPPYSCPPSSLELSPQSVRPCIGLDAGGHSSFALRLILQVEDCLTTS